MEEINEKTTMIDTYFCQAITSIYSLGAEKRVDNK